MKNWEKWPFVTVAGVTVCFSESGEGSYKSDTSDTESIEDQKYTNTITNLIELPSKQSATLKKMTRPKHGHTKNTHNRQSSLSNLSSLFKNRRISKQLGYVAQWVNLF